jgi:hypothetical protein
VYDGKSPLILYQFRLFVVPKLFLQRPTKVSMIAEESWNRKSQNLQQMILENSWRDFQQLARRCVIKVTNWFLRTGSREEHQPLAALRTDSITQRHGLGEDANFWIPVLLQHDTRHRSALYGN